MRILNTYSLLAIILTLGLALPPTPVKALETPQAPAWQVYNQMVGVLPAVAQKPLEVLSMADYQYAPMGTYPNAYPDQSQCVAGVASMKHVPFLGNANSWDDQARAMGYTVSSVPIVGSVAQTDAGGYGHVATVVGIGAGTVTVIEKNFDYHGGVRTYVYPTAHFVYIYL